MGFDFLMGVVGGLLLASAGYSTIQYRALLKIKEEEFTGPTADVMLQLLLALVFCLWAGLKVPGKYLPILSHSKENRLARLPENLDFMTFNHRGKLFFTGLDTNVTVRSKKDL